MIIQVANILSEEKLTDIAAFLDSPKNWLDGKATSTGRACEVKNNLQLFTKSEGAEEIISIILNSISADRLLNAAARPKRFARVIVNRYSEGMYYGSHVDAAFMDGVRCDISFTLFLTNPHDYDGGELVIQGPDGESRFKLDAGHMLFYPSSSIHRVETVTAGARTAAIGWIESRVRSTERRSMLFELDRSIAELGDSEELTSPRIRLSNLRNNLLRTWSD